MAMEFEVIHKDFNVLFDVVLIIPVIFFTLSSDACCPISWQ